MHGINDERHLRKIDEVMMYESNLMIIYEMIDSIDDTFMTHWSNLR